MTRIKLRYRGQTYEIENGGWRGPDGQTVHFLTWVTDDLTRMGHDLRAPDGDLETAERVAERLGEEASVIVESGPAWEL